MVRRAVVARYKRVQSSPFTPKLNALVMELAYMLVLETKSYRFNSCQAHQIIYAQVAQLDEAHRSRRCKWEFKSLLGYHKLTLCAWMVKGAVCKTVWWKPRVGSIPTGASIVCEIKIFCQECQKKYTKKHYDNNREKYIEASKRRNKENPPLNKIIEYKKTKNCEECGDNRWYVLDFHHKDPKEKDRAVSHFHGCSWDKILKEIKKCIVLCANCHREKHFLLSTQQAENTVEGGAEVVQVH